MVSRFLCIQNMKIDLSKIYTDLHALFNCYMVLCESSLEKENSAIGKIVLYEKMIEMLRQVEVFDILSKDNPYVLEDYIHHVKEDTPNFLNLIKQHIEQN